MHTRPCASGVAAALVGLWDYQAVPREHPARRTGAIHCYLNASMLALLLASLLLRRESQRPADGPPRASAGALSGAALSVGTASGSLGRALGRHPGCRLGPVPHTHIHQQATRQR